MTVIEVGTSYVGKVKENPPKSNRHPKIDEWLHLVHKPVGLAWCAAFTSGMFFEATGEMPDWSSASSQSIMRWGKEKHRYFTDPDHLLQCKGALFGWTQELDKAHGHVGILKGRWTHNGEVVAVQTIEGNTDAGGSRLGDGVYSLRRGVPTDGRHRLWFVDMTNLPGGNWWS